jgi:hypothetical protein
MSSKRIDPETMRLRRMSYRRSNLRHDRHPADPVVLDVFKRLQWTKDRTRDHELWHRLIGYLVTMEDSRAR